MTAGAVNVIATRAVVDPERSVFMNYPYDLEYEPLFDALLLTIVTCGFIPRSALESGTVAVSRMDRIFEAINSSHFSIHDLSRCRGEGDTLLARFNMPLELGIAMSRRRSTTPHDWFVLVPANAPYARFVSDLAGFDLEPYDGNEESIVSRVMSWLMTRSQALSDVKPSDVLGKLQTFRKKKAELKTEWGQIPWRLLVHTATQTAAGAIDSTNPSGDAGLT